MVVRGSGAGETRSGVSTAELANFYAIDFLYTSQATSLMFPKKQRVGEGVEP